MVDASGYLLPLNCLAMADVADQIGVSVGGTEDPPMRTVGDLFGELGLQVQDQLIPSMFAEAATDAALRRFVDASVAADAGRRNELVRAVKNYSTPVFGSPPQEWASLSQRIAGGGVSMLGVGFAVASGRPTLVVLSNAGLFVYWFGKPIARVTRRWLTERVAERLQVELYVEDFD